MTHFRDEDWVDFVRGAAPGAQQAAMAAHLAEGCEKCKQAAERWAAVAAFAGRERDLALPDAAVRAVRGYFGLYGPVRPRKNEMVEVARLVFDTLRAPLAAGVRGTRFSTRQYLFQSTSYSLDMRVQPGEGQGKLSLIGQILNTSTPGSPVKEKPVILRSGVQEVAETSTNQFGEFQLEFEAEKYSDLELAISVDATNTIVASLGAYALHEEGTGLRGITGSRSAGQRKREPDGIHGLGAKDPSST